jgi:putative peptide zinc metalloprotease protein
MSGAPQSERWYRMAGLRPRLRGAVRIHRHTYRGQVWHVLEDRASGRYHRFNAQAWRLIQRMDGQHTLDEIWESAQGPQTAGGEPPTQDELMQVLGTLHSADLVQMDVTPDLEELLQRRERMQRQRWLGRLANPMAMRLPLFDPDAMLTRLLSAAGPLAGPAGVVLWLAVVVPALLILPAHLDVFNAPSRDQLLATGNLLMLAVLFPVIKALHELGHGLVCKALGGEVRETGFMVLVLYPVPYVDVSSSSAFEGKWSRMLVGAAGMLTEFFLAALAFYAWLLLEPGTARGVAWNVALLCSVTTLLFNANPLLRFDGYYILCDFIEMPNLALRANRHWQQLMERHVFGVLNTRPGHATAGERRWFLAYAPLAHAYRLIVTLGISLFVASQFFFVGVALALWSVLQGLLWPLFKGLKAVLSAPQFAAHAKRVRVVLTASALALGLGLFVLPVPHHTVAQGVLWLPERAIVRVASPGFAGRWLAQPGAVLQDGDAVLQMHEPALAAKLAVQHAKVEEAAGQVDAAWGRSLAKAEQLEQQLGHERAALARLEDEAAHLTVRTQVAGTLLADAPGDLPGRYLRAGEVVGYLRMSSAPLVRLVVHQGEADAVRRDTRSVEVRLAHDGAPTWKATLARATPAAVTQLPSAALGA